ncbi:hypothetical protein JS44_12410 [Anoxybacillus flavithermus]|uniref:Uncharacterized protein n=1 Tax=Anoxybacillus flavithermus TaxID=33934 RepID=A0A094IX88_9BACL|nr:hypothetical protein JS44_12410 [Anoxybacillus flavithermus]
MDKQKRERFPRRKENTNMCSNRLDRGKCAIKRFLMPTKDEVPPITWMCIVTINENCFVPQASGFVIPVASYEFPFP